MTRPRTIGKGTVGVDSTATGETRLSGAGSPGADGGDGDRREPGVPRAAEAPPAPEFLQQVADEVRAWFPRQIEGPELVLIDVDPRVLHAFWSLPLALVQETRATLGAAGATAPLVLRLEATDVDAAPVDQLEAECHAFDVAVSGLQSRSYIDIEAAARRWQATLGIKRSDGTLIAFARSNVATLPPVGPSPLQAAAVAVSPERAAAAAAAPTETTLPVSTHAATASAATASAAQSLTAQPEPGSAVEPFSPPAPFSQPQPVSTPEPDTAPEPVLAPETAPGAAGTATETGSGAAETATETANEDTSGAATQPFALEEILPLSSFVLGRSGNDVELEVTAELYIHGRVQPGRTLQLFGKDIRVRPDGTFALRRILPNDPTVLTALFASEEASDLEGQS